MNLSRFEVCVENLETKKISKCGILSAISNLEVPMFWEYDVETQAYLCRRLAKPFEEELISPPLDKGDYLFFFKDKGLENFDIALSRITQCLCDENPIAQVSVSRIDITVDDAVVHSSHAYEDDFQVAWDMDTFKRLNPSLTTHTIEEPWRENVDFFSDTGEWWHEWWNVSWANQNCEE